MSWVIYTSLLCQIMLTRLDLFVSSPQGKEHSILGTRLQKESATVVEMPAFRFPSGWSAAKSPKGEGSRASQGLP